MFDAREFHTSKDMEFPHDYEDAFCFDGHRGLATVADGVSSAIFSRQWADLLTQAVVHTPPDLYTEGVFQEWLAARRADWIDLIDLHNLPWNQRQKLQMVGGAFSTLLWLELYPSESEEDEGPAAEQPSEESGEDEQPEVSLRRFRMRTFAVGDCSIFQVRDGKIIRSFPLETAAEFDEDPISICSVNLNRDHTLAFQAIDDEDCLEGDLLVMCSDAIGKWAMTLMEEDNPPDWESYWDKSYDDWIDEIVSLRQAKKMRYDDTTLLLLRVGAEPQLVEPESDEEADESAADSVEEFAIEEEADESFETETDELDDLDRICREEALEYLDAGDADDFDSSEVGFESIQLAEIQETEPELTDGDSHCDSSNDNDADSESSDENQQTLNDESHSPDVASDADAAPRQADGSADYRSWNS